MLEWELWVWGFWCCCNFSPVPPPTPSSHTHRMGCMKSKEGSIQEKMQLGHDKKDPASGSKQVSGSCSALGGTGDMEPLGWQQAQGWGGN